MRLWRISTHADLSGVGGLRYSARWHTKGRPIIYTAEHSAGALSEFLVHVDLEDVPDSFQLITIDVDDDVPITSMESRNLPLGWITDTGVSRRVGEQWLTVGKSLLLRVPSVIIPDAYNVLINLSHPDADKMRIVETQRIPLDPRLVRR